MCAFNTKELSEELPWVSELVQLPPTSTRVIDADEEVFLQYTNLASRAPADGTQRFRGLGHVDSYNDVLTIEFTIPASPRDHVGTIHRQGRSGKPVKRNRKTSGQAQTLSVELAQDKTALRSRKGDTGSVVWHASIDFAQTVLRQYYTREIHALLNPTALSNAHVLELGVLVLLRHLIVLRAGTGLLSVVIAPLVAHYTVTDIEALVPLIRKNLTLNTPKIFPITPSDRRAHPATSRTSNVSAEALDWITLHNASPAFRRSFACYPELDLLLVVDCIYHPSLLPALLSTIDHLTIPGKTAVLVVVELRAEDVVREFLDGWLNISSGALWQIYSVSAFMEGPYAVWIGWKTISNGDA
ncbi:uncharacterized protein FIBRA_07218 [Fibroporia radiculosa]|uniref:Uncharacterized protein n=1 Tax=Fibroporia radiculosa TaxID=599839 RepID=J4H4H8_9APHY|nr:uncharacterized protein FIBRA_07218 [Fibroporia radiculosa]CCM05019.1 predicted protein [Fibroporia radiculosa]